MKLQTEKLWCGQCEYHVSDDHGKRPDHLILDRGSLRRTCSLWTAGNVVAPDSCLNPGIIQEHRTASCNILAAVSTHLLSMIVAFKILQFSGGSAMYSYIAPSDLHFTMYLHASCDGPVGRLQLALPPPREGDAPRYGYRRKYYHTISAIKISAMKASRPTNERLGANRGEWCRSESVGRLCISENLYSVTPCFLWSSRIRSTSARLPRKLRKHVHKHHSVFNDTGQILWRSCRTCTQAAGCKSSKLSVVRCGMTLRLSSVSHEAVRQPSQKHPFRAKEVLQLRTLGCARGCPARTSKVRWVSTTCFGHISHVWQESSGSKRRRLLLHSCSRPLQRPPGAAGPGRGWCPRLRDHPHSRRCTPLGCPALREAVHSVSARYGTESERICAALETACALTNGAASFCLVSRCRHKQPAWRLLSRQEADDKGGAAPSRFSCVRHCRLPSPA